MKNDKQLNKMLSTVEALPASSNLAERIIAISRSRTESTEETVSMFSLLENSLLLFKPAAVLSCMLMVGVLSGWYMNDSKQQNDFVVENELTEFIDYEISML